MVLIREREVAEILGVSLATLRTWRHRDCCLPYYKIGSKSVRYDKAVVLGWLASKAHQPAAAGSNQPDRARRRAAKAE